MTITVKQYIVKSIKKYPFEIIMALIFFIAGVAQLLLFCDDFRAFIIRSMEAVLGSNLDRALWERRFLGPGFKRFLERWLAVFFVVEVYKVFYSVNIYDFLNKIKNDLALRKCLIATPILMLATHIYSYTNASYIHDMVQWTELVVNYYNDSDKWASCFVDLFCQCFNSQRFYLAGYSGFLSVIFATLSVYLLSKIIGYDDWVSILILSGLISTNSCIINAHIYNGGSHFHLIALFVVCLASFLAVCYEKSVSVFISASFLVAFVTGIYGAYMPLYPSLAIALLIIDVLKGETDVKELIQTGLWHLSILFSGMVMYYILLKLSIWYSGSVIQSYMSENELNNSFGTIFLGIIKYIPEAYERYVIYFLGKDTFLPNGMKMIKLILNTSLTIVLVFLIIRQWEKLKSEGRIIILAALLAIWPLSMNLIHILSFGNPHFLMIFPLSTPFLFIPKILRFMSNDICWRKWYHKLLRANVTLMAVIFIFEGVYLANVLYVRIDNMYINSLSIATRLMDRIETLDNFSGKEKVVIIGGLCNNEYYRNLILQDSDNTVLDISTPIPKYLSHGFTYTGTEIRFLKSIMNSTLDIAQYYDIDKYLSSSTASVTGTDTIKDMPMFPLNGSVIKIGNTIYVKLS